MDDPRAKMEGNNLLNLGAPHLDWSKTPGRRPGFWLSAASVVLAVLLPFPAAIAAGLGLSFAMQAFQVIPAGARGRGLVITSLALASATILVVVARTIAAILF
ncbi:hypothetical protein E3T26_06100 [Cryobacterium sp. TMT1-21]|uniref:Uncharacterized protein n=1 Tax=Cryobacterium shii TaxID=1259235 RepID=A0AAQ2C8N0_9MICO|nr:MULTISPECIES: hypothetical protein [Cryobacterium]TFC52203.1 hypothetical protein E3O49_02725 [Cryobacterium shii]TFD14519.1 hypothetical protein E3T42_11725 [Cryobacterium sp. TMT4-10]TFD15670.1 hypothetical protein E3T26_06100 [Cryobacterium sp. TMT1-21]TFD18969.1 hypothetical protein E3T32_11350 [Cryobacterium sp. TMT2-23]TFD39413.1 hypothetical protein E3T37_08155 [Cryobacterium sp. TMT2-10]